MVGARNLRLQSLAAEKVLDDIRDALDESTGQFGINRSLVVWRNRTLGGYLNVQAGARFPFIGHKKNFGKRATNNSQAVEYVEVGANGRDWPFFPAIAPQICLILLATQA